MFAARALSNLIWGPTGDLNSDGSKPRVTDSLALESPPKPSSLPGNPSGQHSGTIEPDPDHWPRTHIQQLFQQQPWFKSLPPGFVPTAFRPYEERSKWGIDSPYFHYGLDSNSSRPSQIKLDDLSRRNVPPFHLTGQVGQSRPTPPQFSSHSQSLDHISNFVPPKPSQAPPIVPPVIPPTASPSEIYSPGPTLVPQPSTPSPYSPPSPPLHYERYHSPYPGRVKLPDDMSYEYAASSHSTGSARKPRPTQPQSNPPQASFAPRSLGNAATTPRVLSTVWEESGSDPGSELEGPQGDHSRGEEGSPGMYPSQKLKGEKQDNVLERTTDEANPWQTCSKFAKQLTDEENASWKDEVDQLLVFSGLFSGVVTAFTLRSFGSVDQGDPAQTTVLLLNTLIRQMVNITNPHTDSNINLNPQIHISQSARRINILWFTSLALSLSTAVLGILCLQWIRAAGRSAYTSHHEHLAILYMRQEGMRRWQVTRMLKLLPALLLVSLLLFFAGLVEVIWQVDETLATFPTVIVGGTVMVVLLTTLAPTLQTLFLASEFKQSQCPYKSPQSWIVFRAVTILRDFVQFIFAKCLAPRKPYVPSPLTQVRSWLDYDRLHLKHRQETGIPGTADVGRGLGWIATTFFQDQGLAGAVLRCLRDLDYFVVLDAFLAQIDQHRANDIRQTQRELIKNARPFQDQQESKIRYMQDLVVVHTLERLGDNIEGRYMSLPLLSQRIQLFLQINEGELTADVKIACPVSRENVDHIHIDTRKRILRCINKMLEKNLPCHETHLKGIFEILRSILLDRASPDAIDPIIQETLNAVSDWIRQGPEPERRLKLGLSLHKLIHACHGRARECFAVVESYCHKLNRYIEEWFKWELDKRNFIRVPDVRQEYLYKYMAWRGLEGHSEKSSSADEATMV